MRLLCQCGPDAVFAPVVVVVVAVVVAALRMEIIPRKLRQPCRMPYGTTALGQRLPRLLSRRKKHPLRSSELRSTSALIRCVSSTAAPASA